MAVHYLLNALFHAAWGVFMIAETARMGSNSSPACDNQDDIDTLEPVCNGYGAGAAFAFFAFVAALAAAILSKAGGVRVWFAFLGSIILYSLAKVSETGGLSQLNCDKDVDNSELCDGYSAAAVFYFFAFAAAIAVAAMIAKWSESQHLAVSTFFAFLALFAIGVLCELGGSSSAACNQDDSGVSSIDDSRDAYCSGFGFATFVAAVAMVVGFVYLGLSFTTKNTGSNLWIGVSVWIALYLLAYTSVYGTMANVDCDLSDDDTDGTKNRCSGEGAATFFTLIAFLLAGAAAFFSFRGHEGFKQLTFLATFSLFYLGYTSYIGGQSAGACADKDDIPKGVKGYVVDQADALCGGYGAAAFFGIISFLLAAAAAVLSQTTHGAPQAEENAEPSAPQEVAIPTATAVPVGDDDKKGADV